MLYLKDCCLGAVLFCWENRTGKFFVVGRILSLGDEIRQS